MATPLTYFDYITQVATMAIVPVDDPNYVTIIDSMISYAEDRIQRDLDFLASQTNISYISVLNAGSSNFFIPLTDFITVQTIQIIKTFLGNEYTTLLPVGKEYIQNVYGYNSVFYQGTPQYFAMYGADGTNPNNYQIIVGPTSDDSYDAIVTGTIRFSPLSLVNSQTFISTYLPELFIMASMIYISAYQRNFGRQSDDPAMAQSYESQYQALLKGATVEEFRKKFQSAGWTSYSPSPISSPTR